MATTTADSKPASPSGRPSKSYANLHHVDPFGVSFYLTTTFVQQLRQIRLCFPK